MRALMTAGGEVDRVLATVAAAINDQQLEHFERDRVQQLIAGALGGEHGLTVDDGGGLHDSSGARIGAIRQTPSGAWIIDRQNPDAAHSEAEIPTVPED
jgi:hypothetical protein